ncbi:Phosphoribosylaminoimidazole-succinocarboxamide synthase (SAICAR synthetase) [Dionaea muscipula]
MAECIGGLSPAKILVSTKTTLRLSSTLPSTVKIRLCKLTTPPFSSSSRRVTVASSNQYPEPPFISASSHKDEILKAIKGSLGNCLSETNLHLTVPGLTSKTRGKVRDIYESGDEYLVLVTTDRQSAFDRVLASIPFKGQVLNETSLWWFQKTQHIAPNAVVLAPDKNVTISKKCSIFPVEFVVRGYVTGSTDTSLWTVYKKGVRNYCGNALPDGLVKNQKLSANILTPTTKAADHDVPVTPDEIIECGLMTKGDYDEVSHKALSLFEYGQRVALEHGLILVDSKYEFGKGSDGTILLVDEVHTPDSSRYWIAQSYKENFQNGLEPENVDKEFLRLWFKEYCNPYEDEVLPDAPEELVSELSWRYIFLFETITGCRFSIPSTEVPIHDRISHNVSKALSSLSDKRLDWLLTFSSLSLQDQDSGRVYSCVDLYLVTQDGYSFKAKYKFQPYFYAATKDKMEMDVEAYLRRRYENDITDIEIVEKEDLDLQLMQVGNELLRVVERNQSKFDAAGAYDSILSGKR